MTGTDTTWSRRRVLELAPDPARLAAAERVAGPGWWSDEGGTDTVLWGSCRGRGPLTHRTLVQPAGPAWRCSCPSRSRPCQHVLALLLRWSEGELPAAAAPPDDAASWLAGHRTARTGAAPIAPARGGAALRAERVRSGLDELDVWLADQVRGGLARLPRAGYGPVDQVAARMVDAQTPGVATLLRALPSHYVGADWPARTLEHLALLRLLVVAHRRLDALPEGLAATVRTRVGYPVAKQSVLARPPVRDRWVALGHVDVADDRLASRRVWLRGTATGRWALLLSFAAGGASLDGSVMPGCTLDADLHRYPGSGQHRALLGTVHAREESVGPLDDAALDVGPAAARFGDLLREDPWAERMPVVLRGSPVVPEDVGGRWSFRGEDGLAVPLVAGVEAWPLLARSMGDPVEVMGEWGRAGLRPLAFLPHPLDPVFSTEVLS